MTEINFTRYNQLCGELDRLALEFEKLGKEQPSLYCARFETWVLDDLNFDEQRNGWKAFQERAAGKVGIPQGEDKTENDHWEHWEHGDSATRFCFYGNPELLTRFDRLSKSGMVILREFEFLTSPPHADTAPGSVPSGYFVNSSTSRHDNNWVNLVFETAELNSTFLRFDEYCYWDYPEISVDWDDLTDEDFWETNSDGVRVPLYPEYQTLHLDLCSSSAEAIRLWRNPSTIVRYSDRDSDSESPICIPNAVPEASIAILKLFKALTDRVSPSRNINDLQRPNWDGHDLLGKNGEFLRSYGRNAKRLTQILAAFQEAGWLRIHDDPCGIKALSKDWAVVDAKERRREAVHDLNKSQSEIVFKCVHGGFRVSWEWRSDSDIPDAITDDGEPPQTN